MFLPCNLGFGSQLPWRTAGDASLPQLEGCLAVSHHLEKQSIHKKDKQIIQLGFYCCAEFATQ